MAKHNSWDLQQMQSLPLEAKIRMTQQRINIWVESWKRYGIRNKKTGKIRYVTDTEEPTEKGHYIEQEKKKDGKIIIVKKLRAGTKLKAHEYVDTVESGKAYVSRSGGKDSDVLGDIVKNMGLDIEHIFINTGLEDRTVREHGKNVSDKTLYPEMAPVQIIKKFGYPIISKEVAKTIYEVRSAIKNDNTGGINYIKKMKKLHGTSTTEGGKLSHYNQKKWKFLLNAPFKISHKCCDASKKKPAQKYENESGNMPIIGIMADESVARRERWIMSGCNAFEQNRPCSNPLSFWTEQDILKYIVKNNIEIASAYGDIVLDNGKYRTTKEKRTGCIFCFFGITGDKEKMARLQVNDPQLADYVLRGGEFGKDGYWQPTNKGLGYWFIIEWLNIHGLGIECYKDIEYSKIYGNDRTREILTKERIKVSMRKGEIHCMN